MLDNAIRPSSSGQSQVLVGRASLTRDQRLIRLTLMLTEQKVVRIRDLCERFGVHPRTVARDIRSVREAGCTVLYDPEADEYRLVAFDWL